MLKNSPEELSPAAANGLLRRKLLAAGAASLGLLAPLKSAAVREPWMQRPGQPFSNYGAPAPRDDLIRWISSTPASAANGLSWCPLHALEGTITPSGLHFERHHNGVPQIDAQRHRLLVHGAVARPLSFSMADLTRYPMVSRTCFVECGGNSNACWREQPPQAPAGYFHGMLSNSEWTGVPAAILLDEAGVDENAGWVIAEGADAFAMNVSVPIARFFQDALLAVYQNGEPVRPENGYPLRLVLPGWEGVLNVKWLRRLHISTRPAMARNETAKYTDLLPDGSARQFSFFMDAKSLITSPSFGMRLRERGVYPISGLAWSGRGSITSVEVSADGGASWAPAELQQPVLPQAVVRFRIPWHWQGQPAVLQSRARDDTGYLQPTRDALIAQRGRQGYFHYNAITSWHVDEDGFIEHIYA